MNPAGPKHTNPTAPLIWGWLALSVLHIALDRWQPGTLAARFAFLAFVGSSLIWLGLRIRRGYLLRRPYWTRESWLRYGRLAVMPVAAVVFVLYVSSFDNSSPAFGAPGTPLRIAAAIVLPAL